MVQVINQDIPAELYQDLYKALQPSNKTAERRFGMFKFGYTQFGKTRGPDYVRTRYPWHIPPQQGGAEDL